MQADKPTPTPITKNSRRDACVPPRAVELEELILGGILMDSTALERVSSLLKPEHFYMSTHAEIYRAALALHEQGDPVDMMTVTGWLHSAGSLARVGGQNRICDLVECCVGAVNIDAYAKVVIEKYRRRKLIEVSLELQRMAQDESQLLLEVQDWAESQVFSLSDSAGQKGLRPVGEILDDEWERMRSPKTRGIETGFYDLDFLTKGFKSHQLITVAGRPGSGKSSFAAAVVRNVAKKHPVALFSLEMAGGEVGSRLLSAESMIDSRVLESGDLTDEQWQSATTAKATLAELPIEIDESRSVAPGHILTECRRMKAKYGGNLGLVVVDYLHLMLDEEDEVKQLGKLTRFFKKMTRELDAPVMILSQLNRAVEARADKRPMMSDLRQSGRIEEDSDIVILLYRDEYYNPDTDDKGIAEVIIAKNRSGPVGAVKLLFQPEFSTFKNMAKGAPQSRRANEDDYSAYGF